MKENQANAPGPQGANWQILGNLQVNLESDFETEIYAWLSSLLNPLNLHSDFESRVLNSAIEAALRAMQAGTAQAFEHIHLLIFAPANHPSPGQTWGFFRIEKMEKAVPEKKFPNHAIELYLYMESQ